MRFLMLLSFCLSLSEGCLGLSLFQSTANLKRILGVQFQGLFKSGDRGCNTVLAGKEQQVQSSIEETLNLAKVAAILTAQVAARAGKPAANSVDDRPERVIGTIMGLKDLGSEAKSTVDKAIVRRISSMYICHKKSTIADGGNSLLE